MNCVECGKTVSVNVGTEENPLCQDCYTRMEQAYAAPSGSPKHQGGSGYSSCPRCESVEISSLRFTWWGGFLGPILFKAVKCNQCGTVFSGSNGRSLSNKIAVYFISQAALLAVVFWILIQIQQRRW